LRRIRSDDLIVVALPGRKVDRIGQVLKPHDGLWDWAALYREIGAFREVQQQISVERQLFLKPRRFHAGAGVSPYYLQ
jgi:hypothetical protein